MDFPLLLTLVISFIISIFLSVYLFKSDPKLPPGSIGLPFVGEARDLVATGKRGVPEKFIFDRIKKYSSKVFKTSLLGETVVLLCGTEGNKFIFSNDKKLLRSWLPRSVTNVFGYPKNVSVDEESMRVHKFIAPYLKPEALRKYVAIMDSVAKQHLQRFWDGQQVLKVHPSAKHYTFTVVCRLFLGIEDPETIARLEKPFSLLTSAFISLPVNIPGTNYSRALKASKELMLEIDEMIKQWKADVVEGRMSPSQSTLFEIFKEICEDDDIPTKILSLLVGAYENTSATLAFVTMYMAQLPYVYEKVLQEQREIVRSKQPGEMLNWADIQKMKYSWNVASEVLRLHPTGVGGFREAITDFTYNGFLIPKGWKVQWSAYGTHKNSECFPNPEQFDPSRFEGNGPMPFSYVPFGGGPRMCPGKEYARLIVLVFMHNVVTKYKWEKIFPDEKIISDPFSKPEKGLPIRLYPYKI